MLAQGCGDPLAIGFNWLIISATVSDDRGGFFDTFGAALVLTDKRKTANPLSVSGLDGSIMFNPKERVLFNAMATKRHAQAVPCAFSFGPLPKHYPIIIYIFGAIVVLFHYLCRR